MMTHQKCGRVLTLKARSNRMALAGGGALLLAAAFLGLASVAAQPAQVTASKFQSESGDMFVSSVQQMSVVIETPNGVICTDPTGGADRYAAYKRPDLILISHEHDEHYDARTLEELAGPETQIVVPTFVMERLPESLRRRAISLANGTSSRLAAFRVEAIPSYGLNGQAARWHPRGRGNAYMVTVDGRSLYIGGSTEAVPEMLELRGIDIAFLPLYSPYALGPEDAVRVASVMQPKSIYIYQ